MPHSKHTPRSPSPSTERGNAARDVLCYETYIEAQNCLRLKQETQPPSTPTFQKLSEGG